MPQSSKQERSVLPNQLSALEQRLGPIEYRDVETLSLYRNNPRKHPSKQLAKLATSIAEFGFAMPVLVDDQGAIIAGEARVLAAKRLGMSKVPVIVAHQWSTEQVRAYRVADNRLAELSEWDEAALAIELAAIIEFDEVPIEILGWESGEIAVVLDGSPDTDADKADDPSDEQIEQPRMPITKSGDLWLLGGHRLLCGSSLDGSSWTALLGDDVAAMAFTNPPSNAQISDHTLDFGSVSSVELAMTSGELSKEKFTAFLTKFISRMLPHLKDGAVLDLCMDWRRLGELLAAIENNDLSLLNLCAWNKRCGAVGPLYGSKHELIFVAKKGKEPHTNNVKRGRHGRDRSNVWDYASVKGKKRSSDDTNHSTDKPIALVADAIYDVTNPDEIVLDAFMGSGTTILAAERSGRRGYGTEFEPRYVDVAIQRWEAMTGRQAVLAATGETYAEVAEQQTMQARAASIAVAASQTAND